MQHARSLSDRPWLLFLGAGRNSYAWVTPVEPSCRVVHWRLIKEPPNLQVRTLAVGNFRRML